jgi:hypothetical protein
MANDTSNTPRFKSPHRYDEQVNIILLIMFLSVVVILSLKGCNACVIDSTQSATESKNKEIVVEGDSTHNDSLTIVHQ